MFAGVLAPYSSAGITGKTYDAATGLIDFGARPYDPQIGRFTQTDTFKGVAEKPATQNPYAYVGNNPVNNTDPTGHAIYYVNLYIDGSFSQIVDLYSPPGTTYFHIPCGDVATDAMGAALPFMKTTPRSGANVICTLSPGLKIVCADEELRTSRPEGKATL